MGGVEVPGDHHPGPRVPVLPGGCLLPRGDRLLRLGCVAGAIIPTFPDRPHRQDRHDKVTTAPHVDGEHPGQPGIRG